MTIASFLKISAALPTAALLVLAGCGGGGSSGSSGSGTPPNSPTPPSLPDMRPKVSQEEDRIRRIAILNQENRLAVQDSVTQNFDLSKRDYRVGYGWSEAGGLEVAIHPRPTPAFPVIDLKSLDDEVVGSRTEKASPYLKDRTRVEYKLSKTTADDIHTIGQIGVDYGNNSPYQDYFVYGWWLTVGHESGVPIADSGSFSSALYRDYGSNRIPRSEINSESNLPSSGSATYKATKGVSGLHTVVYSGGDFDPEPNTFHIAHFEGNVTLNADFGPGVISGIIDGIRYPEGEESKDNPGASNKAADRVWKKVILERADINSGGHYSGKVKVEADPLPGGIPIISSNGSWEGQFSGRLNDDGMPRGTGGTFATEYTFGGGTKGQLLGTFIGGWADPKDSN